MTQNDHQICIFFYNITTNADNKNMSK